MPFRTRPQILLAALVLTIGASLALMTTGEAPHRLLGQLLELYRYWAGQSASGLPPMAEQPYWGPALEATGVLAIGVTALYSLAIKRRRLSIAVTVVGILGFWGASWFFYSTERLLIDPIYPSATLILALCAYWAAKKARDEVLRRRVRSAFGRQLSARHTNRLAAAEGRSYADGERRTVTVLSCRLLDVRALYGAFEDDPGKLIRLFKEFRRLSNEIVLDHDGTIAPNSDERLTAFWNAPLDDPEHARHGCLSAFELVEKIGLLNSRIQAGAVASKTMSYPPLRVGIGIETGPAFVGALQTGQRIGYAALGDTVDQAARLQRQTVNYGTSIIVGQETRRFVTDLPLLELDRVVSKGRKETAKIYTLLEPHLVPSENAFQAHQLLHNAMLYAYRQRHWQEALSYLERCQTYSESLERLYAIYASRIDYYGSAPPGANWDGSVVPAGR